MKKSKTKAFCYEFEYLTTGDEDKEEKVIGGITCISQNKESSEKTAKYLLKNITSNKKNSRDIKIKYKGKFDFIREYNIF